MSLNSNIEPLVSVIVVTWNSASLVKRCLDLVIASQVDFPFEVIVFDNRSGDGTAEIVERDYPDVVLVRSPENLGFGRGNNEAARIARGRYLLLLNPDAYLEDAGAMARLTGRLASDPELAAVAPRLLNDDDSHQVGDAGYAPSLSHIANHQLLFSRVFPGLRGYYVNHPTLLRRHQLTVDWLGGACLLVRKDDFDKAGGFSRDIFMYGEDVDLGCRLTRMGKKLAYLPQIQVLHLQGGTQKGSSRLYVSTKWIDSLFNQYVAEDAGPLRLGALRLILLAGFALRYAGYSLAALLRGRDGYGAKAAAMVRYATHVHRAGRSIPLG